MSTSAIRVLLADDHPALRIGLRVLLEQASDIRIVAEAGDGPTTLERTAALRPDVAVLDCQMAGLSGVEVAGEIRRRGLPTRVLALSAYSDEKYVRGMVEAGALGYLMKEEAPGAIVEAVRAAARGESWFSPAVAGWLRGEPPGHADLTEREVAVLRLVAAGRPNKDIARTLGVTDRTVEFHVTNVLRKLGIASRVEAAVWARDHGLGA